jgi:ribose 5-phosphate isomerase B
LIKEKHLVQNEGCHSPDSVHYPEVAKKVASLVSSGAFDRGILICGTGIGMSMVANRFPNVRAALCHEPFTARMSREHNDANILCIGGRVVGPALAEEMVRVWLSTPFSGGRHAERISMFDTCSSDGENLL